MNIAGLFLLGAGYLIGNPQARVKFGNTLQGFLGYGVDALNKINTGGTLLSPSDGETNAEQPGEQKQE